MADLKTAKRRILWPDKDTSSNTHGPKTQAFTYIEITLGAWIDPTFAFVTHDSQALIHREPQKAKNKNLLPHTSSNSAVHSLKLRVLIFG